MTRVLDIVSAMNAPRPVTWFNRILLTVFAAGGVWCLVTGVWWFGVVFLGLAGLRALQDETGDTFAGDWSWVPYLIVFAALVIGAAIVWSLRKSYRVQKELRQ